jgi:predicted nucleotidyltransferase
MPPRELILATLRDHAAELRAAGLLHLRLFGSVARNEATSGSDIDLLADFAPGTRISLLTLSGLRLQLSDLLGAEVDLSSSTALKEPVRSRAQREAVHVF